MVSILICIQKDLPYGVEMTVCNFVYSHVTLTNEHLKYFNPYILYLSAWSLSMFPADFTNILVALCFLNTKVLEKALTGVP
jgi:hypothetical protein